MCKKNSSSSLKHWRDRSFTQQLRYVQLSHSKQEDIYFKEINEGIAEKVQQSKNIDTKI